VPDDDDGRVIESYRGALPGRRVDPSVFEVTDGLLAILRGDDA
jgi:hypothetical protein